MNFLGFGQSAEIEIVFDGAENRKTAEVKGEDGKVEKMLLYYDGETVSGRVNVTLKKPGSKLEHQGIKIEFIGQIELFYDRGNHHEFKCLAKALARPGDLIQNTSYPFDFPNVEKQFEVYAGSNVRLRYFLRATIVRRISDITREVDIAVHTLCSYPEMNNPIKMEVGIEDCLHIEFEYNKSKYHLKDTIIGKIYFLLVRIKIKHMEIAIIKRESTGSGPNMFTENETIAKYEIMDGAPVKGESIPIRVFLAGYNLTPTMRDINKKFSVKYFLNLVLMDTEDRRYFKQQEITLWRKADIPRYHAAAAAAAAAAVQQQTQQQQQLQHQQVPQHAPPHLVGGPAAPTVAPSLIAAQQAAAAAAAAAAASSSSAAASVTAEGVVVNSNENAMATTHDDDDDIAGVETTTTTTKMGLFMRESPNQEFSQQQIDSPITPTTTLSTTISTMTQMQQSITAATTTTTEAAEEKPTKTTTAAATATTHESFERGIGDGAAATNTSPVMLSTTPPPLPITTTTTAATAATNVTEQKKQKAAMVLEDMLKDDDLLVDHDDVDELKTRDVVGDNFENDAAVAPPPLTTTTELNIRHKNKEDNLTEIALPSPPPESTTNTNNTSSLSNVESAAKKLNTLPLAAD